MTWVRWVALVVLVACGLSGCTETQVEVRADYCEVVKDNQEQLSETMAESGPATLLRALPVFRRLQAAAPRDIEGEWATVVDALSGLDRALDDAGVDPRSYDAADPPADVTKDERQSIAHAADDLARPEVADALEGVRTQSLDVCKTPLYR